MQRSVKDLLAGLVFIVFGLAFAIAASRYQLGTAFRMGPGYFPVVLGGCLVLLGRADRRGRHRGGGEGRDRRGALARRWC